MKMEDKEFLRARAKLEEIFGRMVKNKEIANFEKIPESEQALFPEYTLRFKMDRELDLTDFTFEEISNLGFFVAGIETYPDSKEFWIYIERRW